MSWIFFEYLPDEPAQAGPCPDEELLCGYVERSVADAELRWVESHLPFCSACREVLVFAAAVPVQIATAVAVTERPAGRIRVVLREALHGVRVLAEGFIDLPWLEWPTEPVFRAGPNLSPSGAASDRLEREVSLGPYLLRFPRHGTPGDHTCRLQLTWASGAPMANVPFEVELAGGRRILGQTDPDGWMELGELNVHSIATIWLSSH